MEENLKERIEVAAREYAAAFANVERCERRIELARHELDRMEDERAAYSRDEEDAIETLDSIWSDLDDDGRSEFRNVVLPYIEQVEGMAVFGDE